MLQRGRHQSIELLLAHAECRRSQTQESGAEFEVFLLREVDWGFGSRRQLCCLPLRGPAPSAALAGVSDGCDVNVEGVRVVSDVS